MLTLTPSRAHNMIPRRGVLSPRPGGHVPIVQARVPLIYSGGAHSCSPAACNALRTSIAASGAAGCADDLRAPETGAPRI